MTFLDNDHIQWHPQIDQTLHQFANLLPNWTLLPILILLPNFEGFHRTLQRVRLANDGRLFLRTPVLSHLGLVLMLRPFFPELVMSTDLLSFEHPSILLFCSYVINPFNKEKNHKKSKATLGKMPSQKFEYTQLLGTNFGQKDAGIIELLLTAFDDLSCS